MGERSNAGWPAALRGDHGRAEQEQAYLDLGSYLHGVLYNYLCMRRNNLQYLAQMNDHDLSELAGDFVQDTLVGLAQEGLLDKYRPTGKFTSWAAKVAVREAGRQLRRHQWTTSLRLEPATEEADDEGGFPFPELEDTTSPAPERASIYSDVWNVLLHAFATRLNPRQQQALAMRLQEYTTRDIAEMLETTENNVYILISQARRILKEEMLAAGHTMEDILDAFQG